MNYKPKTTLYPTKESQIRNLKKMINNLDDITVVEPRGNQWKAVIRKMKKERQSK